VARAVTVTLVQYEVTFNTPNNGTLIVTIGEEPVTSGDLVDYGSMLTITATPAEGYEIELLTVNGVAFTSGEIYEVVGVTHIACLFALVKEKFTVTLTADPSSAGTVSGGGEYAEDDLVTIIATAVEDWRFVEWVVEEGDIVLTDPTKDTLTFTMPDKDVVIKAVFEEVKGSNILPTEITTPITVWISNGVLHITGLLHGERYQIYSVSGTILYQGIVTSDPVQIENIRIQSGAYILRTATQSVKFIK
jgi:hypothetical protein